MNKSKNSISFKYLVNDLPAGLVVFLVALPLCLGISLASGAPFFSGIISGIIGGIVIGALSQSNLSVSGPAAGLAALVLAAITNIGDFRLFLCAVIIAGAIQVLMGAAKLGGIANYFPSSVIKGMLTSIGILIIAKQIPHAFGYDRDEAGNLTQLFPFGNEDLVEFFKPLHHIDVGVFLICLVSILVILFWERPAIKSKFKFIPGALVAVIVAVILTQVFKYFIPVLNIEQDHFVNIRVASSVGDFFSFFTLPDIAGFTNGTVIITGVMLAIIASLETLLCIEAVDNLDPERNVTNTNRELFAQGTGNIISGLIGGLPITSVIVRSSANIQAGAKTKVSSIFHGLLLLVCVISIPALLNMIPLSALAAILILTGYKLTKLSIFKQMISNGKYQYIPFFVTVMVIIGIDLLGLVPGLKGEGLLVGVVAGLIAAIGALLHGNLKNSYYFHKEKHKENDIIKIHLSEEVSFLNKASIRETLDHLPENSTVVIDASSTKYIEFDVLEIIKEFRDIKAPLKNINCTLTGFKEVYKIENNLNVKSSH
ncbi:MAG TPA: SulP family inorganic anion transporter [Saprospiraceae bacterium]|nr:SulP family inorganic anion transporter [Saprospiraceae bacterium]HUN15914.1 SulP family inorganic anion transporter [Saprospiraceae bacterium]